MKKIFLGFFVFLSMIVPVSAKENKLYFTESNDRLYYESKRIDENFFMKHLDMVPGSVKNDILMIENGTGTNYKLYFQVRPREQSALANELLENILMKISLDGNLIYDGIATGIDYKESGINLQDVVYLGEFNPETIRKMEVEVSLSKNYSNAENQEFSYIDWAFYAQYGDSKPTEIVKVPNTEANRLPFRILSVGIILIGIGVIVYAKKQKN